MSVDILNIIARQERELTSIEKLCKLRLIRRSANVAFFVTYYRVSNAVLKTLMKAYVCSLSLLRKVRR